MNKINRVQYREGSELFKVTTKEEMKNAIMKENSSWFRLAYSSSVLEDNLCQELSLSGKRDLSIVILHS